MDTIYWKEKRKAIAHGVLSSDFLRLFCSESDITFNCRWISLEIDPILRLIGEIIRPQDMNVFFWRLTTRDVRTIDIREGSDSFRLHSIITLNSYQGDGYIKYYVLSRGYAYCYLEQECIFHQKNSLRILKHDDTSDFMAESLEDFWKKFGKYSLSNEKQKKED